MAPEGFPGTFASCPGLLSTKPKGLSPLRPLPDLHVELSSFPFRGGQWEAGAGHRALRGGVTQFLWG